MKKQYRGFRLSKAQVVILELLEENTWTSKTNIISGLLERDVISPAGAPKAIDGLIRKKLLEDKKGKLKLTLEGVYQKTILKNLEYF